MLRYRHFSDHQAMSLFGDADRDKGPSALRSKPWIRHAASLVATAIAGVALLAIPLSAPGYLSTPPVGARSWYWQHPSPQGNDIRDASFADGSTGWAVGRSGVILNTSDGGATWTHQRSNTTAHLAGVSFVSATRGWAVGDNNTVLRTVDGGMTWTAQALPGSATYNLRSVAFRDADNGILTGSGGVIFYTSNGGQSWALATDPIAGAELTDCSWSTATDAYIVGANGIILKSTNGGSSWIQQSVNTNAGFNGVSFAPGTETGFVVGNVSDNSWRVYKTTNGGTTWTLLTSNQPVSMFAVHALDPSIVMVVGANGAMWRSTNGGASWTQQSQTQLGAITMRTVHATSATDIYVAGDFGQMLRSKNSGGSWSYAIPATVASVNGIAAASSQVQVAAGGSGAILRSPDSGATWTRQATPTSSDLNDVVMPTSQTGWAVGNNGVILRTSDGGVSWTSQTGFVNQTLTAVAAASATNAVAVGHAGWAGITTNGGVTWVPTGSKVPGGTNCAGVHVSGSTIWVASAFHSSGVLHRSDDAGTNWVTQPAPLPANTDATDVFFLTDGVTGWATASNGAVLKTTNGGNTWTVAASGSQWAGRPLRQVLFTSGSSGVVVGDGGLVARTTDGGTSWSVQDAGSSYHTFTSLAAAGDMVWVTGGGGAILRTTDQSTPITALTLDPVSPNGLDSWYVTKPQATLSATGAATTFYSWNDPDGPFWPYSAPLQTDEGIRNLYYYSVSAADIVEPLHTAVIKVDTVAPTPPLSVSATATTDVSIEIGWSLATDQEPGSGLKEYRVLINGTEAASVQAPTTSYAISGLSPNTTYTLRVAAVDNAGNVSVPSDALIVSTLATDDSPVQTSAPVIDAVDGSPIEPDGDNGWYVTQPFVSLETTPAVPGVTSRYWLSSDGPAPEDRALWNVYSAPLAMPVGDTTVLFFATAPGRPDEPVRSVRVRYDPIVPETPSDLTTTSVTFDSVTLDWAGVTAPQPSGIDRYEVWDDYIGSTSNTEYKVTGLSEQTTYEFVVYAVSGAGLFSSKTETLTVTTDAAPLPNPPSIVSATAPSGEFTFINWMPSADIIGDVSYRVWRSDDGVDFEPIAVVANGLSGRSYIDASVSSSTRYYYAISTIDDRGESALSDTSEATWPWIGPVTGTPERPGGLKSIEGSATISLSWLPATNPKVTGYYVMRSDRSLGGETTMTPAPVPATVAPLWIDDTAVNGQPYWYRIKAVDESGAIGKRSIELEAEARAGFDGPNAHVVNEAAAGCTKCHSAHSAPMPNPGMILSVEGENEIPLCTSCHTASSGMSSTAIAEQISDPKALSGSAHSTTRCMVCHRVHTGSEDESPGLIRLDPESDQGANGMCYSCHGTDSTLQYGDMTVFEGSGHSTVSPPSSGSGVTCIRCHEPHTSRNDGLTRYEDFMQCMQCHTAAAVEPAAPDIWTLLTLSDEVTSRHPILPSDREAAGGSVTCQNCHNTHTTTKQYPNVDPYDPAPSGTWTTSRGNQSEFCLTCHDGGTLPTADQTEPWAPAVTGRGGATVAPDVASTWGMSPHGAGVGSNPTTTTANLRPEMGFSYGDQLECRSCHQHHGSANMHMIRQDIRSADGDVTFNGIACVRIPAGALGPNSPEGHDLRFMCGTCHVFNPLSHDERAGIEAPDSTAQFPYDCTTCHNHASGL